ncbi:CidA/LrgA family protein [Paraburkholderia phytofirmans]|uniref:LrgA family protein n=1 Tax=Paraburkholderia phytofirmans (strain DSM 17436 / LMG 22146 / PsJN) TaxID=398527 RepID=B2TB99_PARPJ|nr:CidA/LrgA family protein [Paraburkholderia phytofirmans]ACD20841.1 LrgA family protein [Paraburkholderia phytofirmans PsJN]
MTQATSTINALLLPQWRGPLQALALVGSFMALSHVTASISPDMNPAITGFVLVLVGLASKALPLSIIEAGAKFLIAQSALFLIPAVVAVARQSALLQAHWIPLLVIVVGGTAISAAATALAVEFTTLALARRRS